MTGHYTRKARIFGRTVRALRFCGFRGLSRYRAGFLLLVFTDGGGGIIYGANITFSIPVMEVRYLRLGSENDGFPKSYVFAVAGSGTVLARSMSYESVIYREETHIRRALCAL